MDNDPVCPYGSCSLNVDLNAGRSAKLRQRMMILKNHIKMCLAVGGLVLGFDAHAQPVKDALPMEPCTLTLPGTPISAPAECGQLSVMYIG